MRKSLDVIRRVRRLVWLSESVRGGAVEDEVREVEWVGGGGECHEHLVDHGKDFCLYFYYY